MGDVQRSMLTDMGDPDLVKERTKRYVLATREPQAAEAGYDAAIPVDVPGPGQGKSASISFHLADDFEGAAHRIRQVQLRMRFKYLASADRLTVLLNGESLAGEACTRDLGRYVLTTPSPHIDEQYSAQWLEFDLTSVRPRQGRNVLEVSLDGRPEDLTGTVSVEDVEVVVEYGPYPSTLEYAPPS